MTVKIEGLEKVVKKLDALNSPGIFKKPMTQAVQHIKRKIARPPRKDAGAFSRLATPAQRRAFWARVNSGEIQFREGVGYVRTNQLRNSWTEKVTNGGRRGEVGTNIPYGPFVQGDRQQPFHEASGWPVAEEVAKEEADTVVRIFKRAYDEAINK